MNTFHFHSSPIVDGIVWAVGFALMAERRREMASLAGSMEEQKVRLDLVYSWLVSSGASIEG
jgi:hypothetical protein